MAIIEVLTHEEKYSGLITEGTYQATTIEVDTIGKSKNKEELQLIWTFSVSWEGTEVELPHWTPLQGKGVSFTREVLDILGVAYDETKGQRLKFDTDDVRGKVVGVNVKNVESSDGSGKKRNSIVSFFKV